MNEPGPVSPGELLLKEFLEPMNAAPGRLSAETHIHESEIREILSGKGRISADTASLLSAFFGTTPQCWLNLQNRYDLDIHEAELRGQQL